MFGSLQPNHTGIDVPQPKGTKRIGETNRVVWKSSLIIHTALPNIRKWIGTFHKLQ